MTYVDQINRVLELASEYVYHSRLEDDKFLELANIIESLKETHELFPKVLFIKEA